MDYNQLQLRTTVRDQLMKFYSIKKSYHTRSVKPLKRCIVGGQLLSIERMHSR